MFTTPQGLTVCPVGYSCGREHAGLSHLASQDNPRHLGAPWRPLGSVAQDGPVKVGCCSEKFAVSLSRHGVPQVHRSADGARVVPNLLTYVWSRPLIIQAPLGGPAGRSRALQKGKCKWSILHAQRGCSMGCGGRTGQETCSPCSEGIKADKKRKIA